MKFHENVMSTVGCYYSEIARKYFSTNWKDAVPTFLTRSFIEYWKENFLNLLEASL